MTSESFTKIARAEKAIAEAEEKGSGLKKGLEAAIDGIDLQSLKEELAEADLSEETLISACNYAMDGTSFKNLDFILEVWEELYGDMVPFVPYLYTLPALDISILRRIAERGSKSFLYIGLELLEVEEQPHMLASFERLYQVYGEQEPSVYRNLFLEINARMHNGLYSFRSLVEYLDSRFDKVKGNQAPPPPYLSQSPSPLLSAKYGPPNKGEVMTENKSCMVGIGCHMLLCNHITEKDIENEDEELKEWFIGHCEVCHLRLKKPSYAMRRPMVTGGWVGCYCSSDCVIRDTPFESFESPFIVKVLESLDKEIEEDGINEG